MPRFARLVGPGLPHHIVQRGNNRQTIFFDDNDRLLYLDFLEKYCDECACAINAYCLMLNHVHMVLIPEYGNSLAKAMQKISMRYAQYINKKYRRTGRLWECRYYSSIVQKDAYLWAVCRYVERNPVRAKMVDLPEEFTWSSAGREYQIIPKRYNFITPIWHDEHEKEAYINYRNMPDDDDALKRIRESSHQGKPIGQDEFIQYIANRAGIELILRPRGRPWKR